MSCPFLALLQLELPSYLQPAADAVSGILDGLIARLPHLLSALIVLLFGAWLSRPVSRAICRIANRGMHENLAEVLSRIIRAVIIVLAFLIAAVIVFPAFRPGDLIAGLGITSVAIGFAFKDILQNFFAGILILWRQPFRVGDEIKSGEYEGVVEDINTRSTRIRTYNGERAVLPNGDVYTRAILVRTAYANRRISFTVGIGYRDGLEEARRIIHSVLARTEGVLKDPGPWVYVTELAPSSVDFTIYFWVEPEQRNALRVRDRVVTSVKEELDRAGIDIPYPHTVVQLERLPPETDA